MTTTTTPFIDTNRLRLAEFAAYTQSKADIDFVRKRIYLLLKSTHDFRLETLFTSC